MGERLAREMSHQGEILLLRLRRALTGELDHD